MSFNGAFTISQGTDPTSFVLTDTSVGSDPSLTDRQISLVKDDGTTLVPAGSSTTYIDWPLTDGSTKVLTGILPRDYSLNIVVNWISSSPLPSPSTYNQNTLNTFTGNLELFSYSLTQLQTANSVLVGDNRYFPNKSRLRLFIDDASNATVYGDQYNAQKSLDAGYKMQVNKQYLF